MKRSDVIRTVAACVDTDALIIANLGFPSRELAAYADRPGNFYMLGSMGLASSVGLGCSLFTDHRVYVIDGDGSVLMNAGMLATLAHHSPDNLCIIIIDNSAYGSTGGQPTYTAQKTDIAGMARAAGSQNVVRVRTKSALKKAIQRLNQKAAIIVAYTKVGNENVPVIALAPREIKERFMKKVIKKKDSTKY